MARRLVAATLVPATLVIALAGASLGAHRDFAFTLTSTDMKPGTQIAMAQVYSGMGCGGGNQSPALQWSGAPPGTKSFAITMYDPDAPTGSGWWHWLVYNIPANVMSLPTGAGDPKKSLLPAGAMQGNTDFGAPGYGGPCPPKGDKPHHYITTVFALNVEKIDVPPTATAAVVGFNLNAHKLGTAVLMALYSH